MRHVLDTEFLLQTIAMLDKLAKTFENSQLPIDTAAIRTANEELTKAHTFLRWQEDSSSWQHRVN
jgi:hypothetical protein